MLHWLFSKPHVAKRQSSRQTEELLSRVWKYQNWHARGKKLRDTNELTPHQTIATFNRQYMPVTVMAF